MPPPSPGRLLLPGYAVCLRAASEPHPSLAFARRVAATIRGEARANVQRGGEPERNNRHQAGAEGALVLASTSPRRRLLLALLPLPFQTVAVEVDETPLAGEPAAVTAHRLAKLKARQAPARADQWVLAADTVVILDQVPLGKPADAADAARMLRALRGRWHEVVTGVCLRPPGASPPLLAERCTRVLMRSYRDDEIAAAVASGVPLDKAGAYAIQDEVFRPVAALEGCYLNVVGLPLCAVSELLRRAGHPAAPALPPGPFQPPCSLCLAGARLPGLGGLALLTGRGSSP